VADGGVGGPGPVDRAGAVDAAGAVDTARAVNVAGGIGLPDATARAPRGGRWAAPLVVLAVILVNIWRLRATQLAVSYLDDAAVHEQMVRYATSSWSAGRLPLSGWYPYLNLGSPQFLHYQSLGAMVTGLVGLAVGGDVAFRWSLLLLVGCWPVVIYLSARIMGLGRWAAVAAAAVTPLVASVPAAGYEPGAYLWVGYGLWAQLCGSWALPFAWATTWRATTDRRFVLPAGVCVAATVTLHYETGYLAVMAVIVFPFLAFYELRRRVLRAALVLLTAVLLAAWTIVPLLVYAKWAAINQALQGGPLENGYGAHQVLSWLVNGGVFDGTGLPVVTIVVAVGALAAIIRWIPEPAGRALLVIGLLSLILCFGRTTFGAAVDIVPASHDVFFRRFMMGTQLAGIYLAGVGITSAGRLLMAGLAALRPSGETTNVAPAPVASTTLPAAPARRWGRQPTPKQRLIAVVVTVVVAGAVLVPAIHQAYHLGRRNSHAIAVQRTEEHEEDPQIGALISYVKSHGDGRVYAGSPDNWGTNFTVGSVQVYKYLAGRDVDQVGFTLRTAALMSQPEFRFDDVNPSDYVLFGIRYLILPTGMAPPVPARSVMVRSLFHLWVIPANSYVSVVDTVGTLTADRGDVGTQSIPYLDGGQFGAHQDLTVAWDGSAAADLTQPGGNPPFAPPGTVVGEQPALAAGRLTTTVRLRRRAVVVLSASYDPGWHATVDGRPASTEMLAPAVVGVVVGPGTHRVVFVYDGYGHYDLMWLLILVGVVVGLAIGFVPLRQRSRRRSRGDMVPAGVVES
jgi:hypothetical protein